MLPGNLKDVENGSLSLTRSHGGALREAWPTAL